MVWQAIWERGRAYDIVPYGTETMHVLRAEKGYIIIGQETDGTVTPDDAGLAWAIGKAKPDFVGKRRSEENTSELQSLMSISYAVFCLKQKTQTSTTRYTTQ